MTLEQVEQLAAQLPPKEQLKLFSRLSEQLMEAISQPATISKKERVREAAVVLCECDRTAAVFTRKTDSAETIRRMREERHRQIARRFNQRRVYDATYAALAELRDCEFWTADRAFYEAVKAGLTFVKYLPDYP